jgi:hypothetical protein
MGVHVSHPPSQRAPAWFYFCRCYAPLADAQTLSYAASFASPQGERPPAASAAPHARHLIGRRLIIGRFDVDIEVL